jgi:hypothetical protein
MDHCSAWASSALLILIWFLIGIIVYRLLAFKYGPPADAMDCVAAGALVLVWPALIVGLVMFVPFWALGWLASYGCSKRPDDGQEA